MWIDGEGGSLFRKFSLNPKEIRNTTVLYISASYFLDLSRVAVNECDILGQFSLQNVQRVRKLWTDFIQPPTWYQKQKKKKGHGLFLWLKHVLLVNSHGCFLHLSLSLWEILSTQKEWELHTVPKCNACFDFQFSIKKKRFAKILCARTSNMIYFRNSQTFQLCRNHLFLCQSGIQSLVKSMGTSPLTSRKFESGPNVFSHWAGYCCCVLIMAFTLPVYI